MRVLKLHSSRPESQRRIRRSQVITQPFGVSGIMARLRVGNQISVISDDALKSVQITEIRDTMLNISRPRIPGIYRKMIVSAHSAKVCLEGLVVGCTEHGHEKIKVGQVRIITDRFESSVLSRDPIQGIRLESCIQIQDIYHANLMPNPLRHFILNRYTNILKTKFPGASVTIYLQENDRASVRMRILQESRKPIYIRNSKLPPVLRTEDRSDLVPYEKYTKIKKSEGDATGALSEVCIPIVYQQTLVHGYCLVSLQNEPIKTNDYEFISGLINRLAKDITNLYAMDFAVYPGGIREISQQSMAVEIDTTNLKPIRLRSELLLSLSFTEQKTETKVIGKVVRIGTPDDKEVYLLETGQLSEEASSAIERYSLQKSFVNV